MDVEAGACPSTRARLAWPLWLLVAGVSSVFSATASASIEAWPVPFPSAFGEFSRTPLEPSVAPDEHALPRSTAPQQPVTLLFPVPEGRRTGLESHFLSRRGRFLHHAVDIVAPRLTPIHAAAEGTIVRLHRSRTGGIGIEEIDASGQYCLYYAHLQRYAPGLKVGQPIGRDQVVGFVGSTGYARGPHLHFQVMKLEAGQDCWQGAPLDPLLLFEQPPLTLSTPEAPRHVEGQ